MPRRLLITALMSTGLLATAIAAQQTPTASPAVPAGVVARAADAAPESRVEAEQAIIAPGGSVIYGKEAMEHLKSIGLVVYLKITYDELVKRVGDVKDRGVALKDGMTLLDLYHERISYFEKYADITIDEEGKELGAVVDELREILEERGYVLGSAPEKE